MITLVVAMDEGGVIGRGGALPWRLPADLAHFKRVTMGKPLIMGRRTYESIGRPLPGRETVVVTRDPDFRAPGCRLAGDLDEALAACEGAEEVMVAGGAEVFAAALPRARRMWLTRVHARLEGDVRMPEIDWSAWREAWREAHPADAANPYPYTFLRLERAAPGAG